MPPDRFIFRGIAADQLRRQMVVQQGDDRRAARADRVCVACAFAAVATTDRDQHRFLNDERLDGIRAPHLRLKVDLPDFHGFDEGHGCFIL